MRRIALTTLAAVLCAACAATSTFADETPSAASAISAALADPQRPSEDTARDEARKPAQIIAFAGVKPGMTVIEYAPGGGYYTRLLASSVGPDGKVYALIPKSFATRQDYMERINALAAQYGNVVVVPVDFGNYTLPEQADLAWTSENYHDFVNGGSAEAMDAQTFAALKPGGIFYVEDHAAPGTGLSVTNTMHRIDPEAVKSQVIAAGFVLDAESDILHNPDDPHAVSPFDFDGVTDKLALRFRKPG